MRLVRLPSGVQLYRPLLWSLLVSACFLLLAWQHLHLPDLFSPTLVFGNDGDGFFNLWVLEHNRRHLLDGPVSWTDGRIFYPENARVLFWSDILLVPTLPYCLFHAAGFSRFTSYRLTTFLLAFIGFIVIFVAQQMLHTWARTRLRRQTGPYSLLFTVVLCFSVNQLMGYHHFQNLSWIGLVLALVGAVGFSLTERAGFLALICVATTGLLVTAPYFAIMTVVLLVHWLLLHGCRYGPGPTVRRILSYWQIWLPFALAVSIPLVSYLQAPHIQYSDATIHHELSTRPGDLVIPPDGLLHSLLHSLGWNLPDISNESPAYLGIGFMLLLMLLPLLSSLLLAPTVRNSLLRRLAILAGCYLAYRIFRDAGLLGYVLAWLPLLMVPLLLLTVPRSTLQDDRSFIMLLLASSALFCYGFAFGPNHHFLDQGFNPSMYGLVKQVLPGASSMRAIGRMSGVGHLLLGLWLSLLVLSLLQRLPCTWQRHQLALLVVLALLGQTLEAWPTKAMAHDFEVDRLVPSPAEDRILGSLRGSIAVFPMSPFHKNTHSMLYLDRYPNLMLFNGYSGHSSPLFDRLLAAGSTDGEPSPAQIDLLLSQGCDYILVWNHKVKATILARLQLRFPTYATSETFTLLTTTGTRELPSEQ
jgi:hypothetical protein